MYTRSYKMALTSFGKPSTDIYYSHYALQYKTNKKTTDGNQEKKLKEKIKIKNM